MEVRQVDTPYGKVEYVLTKKAVRNYNLRLRGDGIPALSAPQRVSAAACDKFVAGHMDWIRTARAKLAQAPAPLAFPEPKTALPILTRSVERMAGLTAPLGVKMPAVKGRKMTSRWGSCHYAKGVVVLNTALAALDPTLIDYVALHELVHFLHPNHGAGFYAVMDKLMPDWQERRRALKEYRLEKGR